MPVACGADSNSGLDALATLAASSLSGLGLEGLELDESLNVVAGKRLTFNGVHVPGTCW